MKINILIIGLLIILSLTCCKGVGKEEYYAQAVEEIKKNNPNGALVFLKNAIERDSDYYDARVELAKVYLLLEKYELAEKEFVKLLQLKADRDEIRLELAKLYILDNKSDLAISEIKTYVASHGVSADTFELLGIIEIQQGEPFTAEGYFLKALAADPGRIKIKQELAGLYVRFHMKGKEGEARRLIDELIKANPKDTRAYYTLADLEISSGNKEKGLTHLQTIYRLDANDSNALYKAGTLMAGQGDLVAAKNIAQTLIKQFPRRSEGHRLVGIIQYHEKKYSDAIASLLVSMTVNSSNEANYYLGLSYYRRGELESALSQFYKLVDSTIYSEPSRLLLGIILLNQNRIDYSITEIKKLLAIQPNHALAHNILGSAYMAKGLFDEGMKELNRAIELDPHIVDAHLKKGVYHLHEGSLQDAEIDFTSAVQSAPDLLNTRYILSSFYLRENKPQKAIMILKEALNGKKSDAVIYDNIASVLFFQNKQSEGLSYLLKAQQVDPEYAAAMYHLATYYTVTGKPEQALGEYRRLLEKYPQNYTALLNMGALLELLNRDSEAFEVYQQGKASKQGAAYLALADYLLRKSRHSEALEILSEAIKMIPRNIPAQQMKYHIHLKRKEFKEAIGTAGEIEIFDPQLGLQLKIEVFMAMEDKARALEMAGRYVSMYPNSAFGYILQSMIYERLQEFDAAVDALKNGIRVDRENIDAMVKLGNLYARRKEYKFAKSIYAEAMRKDLNSVAVIFAQGTLHDAVGEKAEAIKKYQEVLAKDDKHVPALNNLAYLYVSGYGPPAEGLRLAFDGFRYEPGNPLLIDTLGLALLKNGRSDAARKVLERAAKQMPDVPSVAYHLALAYREVGMKAEAKKVLSGIVQRNDFPEASEAKRIYETLEKGN